MMIRESKRRAHWHNGLALPSFPAKNPVFCFFQYCSLLSSHACLSKSVKPDHSC